MKVNVEPDHETDDVGLAVNIKTERVLKQESFPRFTLWFLVVPIVIYMFLFYKQKGGHFLTDSLRSKWTFG